MQLAIWKKSLVCSSHSFENCWHFWYSKLNTEELSEITTSPTSVYLYFPALWPSKDIKSFTFNVSILTPTPLLCRPWWVTWGDVWTASFMGCTGCSKTKTKQKIQQTETTPFFCLLNRVPSPQISGISAAPNLHREGWSNDKASSEWWLNNKYELGYYSRPWE